MIGLAGATRPQAMLLLLPFVLEFLLQWANWRSLLKSFAVGLVLTPIGTLAYFVWLQSYLGGSGSPVTAYSALAADVWKTSTTWPWVVWWDGIRAVLLGEGIHPDWFSRAISLHDLFYALLMMGLAAWSYQRLRLSTWVYLLVGAVSLYVVHGPAGYAFWSIGRRAASIAPVYVCLALIAVKLPVRAQYVLFACSTLILGVMSAWFASGRWVA
jgi:hypothetical protein